MEPALALCSQFVCLSVKNDEINRPGPLYLEIWSHFQKFLRQVIYVVRPVWGSFCGASWPQIGCSFFWLTTETSMHHHTQFRRKVHLQYCFVVLFPLLMSAPHHKLSCVNPKMITPHVVSLSEVEDDSTESLPIMIPFPVLGSSLKVKNETIPSRLTAYRDRD